MRSQAGRGDWAAREAYWRLKLGRLKLGVEPLQEQLDRYRRVTWGLTAVAGTVALLFVALFSAFSAPALGLVIGGLVFTPVAGIAWMDYLVLRSRKQRYETERRMALGAEDSSDI